MPIPITFAQSSAAGMRTTGGASPLLPWRAIRHGRTVDAVILNAWAQLESDQISERVRKAMPVARAKNYHLGRPPVGFVWVEATKTFEPTEWALAVETDALAYGGEEAGRLHPYPNGKRVGERVSARAVRRILENLQLYRDGRLVPNGVSDERYGYHPLRVARMTGEVTQIKQNPVLSL